jgi:predicted Zn-dependent protease with MMP-like domain
MTEDNSVDEFETMIVDSIERLPEEFQVLLERVPVVISERRRAPMASTSAMASRAKCTRTGS